MDLAKKWIDKKVNVAWFKKTTIMSLSFYLDIIRSGCTFSLALASWLKLLVASSRASFNSCLSSSFLPMSWCIWDLRCRAGSDSPLMLLTSIACDMWESKVDISLKHWMINNRHSLSSQSLLDLPTLTVHKNAFTFMFKLTPLTVNIINSTIYDCFSVCTWLAPGTSCYFILSWTSLMLSPAVWHKG